MVNSPSSPLDCRWRCPELHRVIIKRPFSNHQEGSSCRFLREFGHKEMLLIAIMAITLATHAQPRQAADDWSQTVNGLKARLALERDNKSPFVKVFLEIQNTSDTAGLRKIRFEPKTLDLHVADSAGNPLPKANGPYDGMSLNWAPLLLPYEGTLRFRVSFPGLGYRPEKDRTIIDLGPSSSWIIPDDKEYFLSGTLTIPKKEGDHPHLDWSGTLALPATKIPAPAKGESGGPRQAAR
jgi:hypothetical protein